MGEGDFDRMLAVAAVRMVTANVEVYTAGARDRTDDREVARSFPAENSSRLKAILDRGCFDDRAGNADEVTRNSRDNPREFSHSVGIKIESQAAWNRNSAPIARSTRLCGCSKQGFLEACR